MKDKIDWYDNYLGKTIELSTGTSFTLDEDSVKRAAVKYGIALNTGIAMANHIQRANEKIGRDYEIEFSVDETEQPTTLAPGQPSITSSIGFG